MTQRIPPG